LARFWAIRKNVLKSHAVTFGCRLNTYESGLIEKALSRVAPLNTVVVNTCAVTAEAERQAQQAIRRLKRENPEAFVVVTGCSAQLAPERFSDMPEVGLVLGNREKLDEELLQKKEGVFVGEMAYEASLPMSQTLSSVAARTFLQIQNGCDHACTFCAVTHARGPSQSVPVDVLASHVRQAVAKGAQEIILTGVDLTAYGRDLEAKTSLATLVSGLLRAAPDLKRLRISSLDPAEVEEGLVALIANEPRIAPHFHLSLQAGADLILKRMKRRHLRDDVFRCVGALRRARPDVALGADVIVGFPTETDVHFQDTCQLVEACAIPMLHVFPFSPRPGTPAARMPQVDKAIIKQRGQRLRRLGDKLNHAYLERFQGRCVEVLMEKEGFGYSAHYVPVVLEDSASVAPGMMVRARITGLVHRGHRTCLRASLVATTNSKRAGNGAVA
jgi:threonylcarbamoyladenosine tRNA methylthiotransferase MtaB